MPARKQKKPQTPPPGRESAVEAALSLAAQQGWERTSLREIALHAGMSLPELFGLFEDKADVLAAYGRMLDRRVLEAAGTPDPDSSARDRLFDVLMERFEALNDHRGGVIAILRSFRADPKQAVIACPHLARSMSWMLEAAGIDTGGLRGAVKVAGLTGLYLKVLRDWAADESPDLGRTMAALDKALSRAEKAANTLGLKD